jgi:hypothetical protein
MTNRKMIDYRVRIQVAEDSPDGVLLDFLKHERHPSFSHKEMVLWALRGYWMAIAFRWRWESGAGKMSEVQMQQMALDAVHQLKQQMVYIQATFEMEVMGGNDRKTITSQHSSEQVGKVKMPLSEKSIGDWDEGDDLFDSSI